MIQINNIELRIYNNCIEIHKPKVTDYYDSFGSVGIDEDTNTAYILIDDDDEFEDIIEQLKELTNY